MDEPYPNMGGASLGMGFTGIIGAVGAAAVAAVGAAAVAAVGAAAVGTAAVGAAAVGTVTVRIEIVGAAAVGAAIVGAAFVGAAAVGATAMTSLGMGMGLECIPIAEPVPNPPIVELGMEGTIGVGVSSRQSSSHILRHLLLPSHQL